MNRAYIGIIILSLSLGRFLFAAPGPDLPAGAETIRGAVLPVTAGGVETSVRPGLMIGARRFFVAGNPLLVAELMSLVGHQVEVKGVVTPMFYVGGEGFPLLTPLVVTRLCKCAPVPQGVTDSRLARVATTRVMETISGGCDEDPLTTPRLASVRVIAPGEALVSVEWVLDRDVPIVTRGHGFYLYYLDEDQVCRIPPSSGADPVGLIDRARSDALGRYSHRYPPQDPAIADRIYPVVRDIRVNPDGSCTVKCERFGGIAAIWHGQPIAYRYDRNGRLVSETEIRMAL